MMNDNINDVAALFDKVIEALRQYDDGQTQDKRDVDFNIFEAIGIKNNEVKMCAFLASLIDPDGKHGVSSRLLHSFCESVLGVEGLKSWEDAAWKNAMVSTEVKIDGDRRIDILISVDARFIPIEVKLYAGDQKNQCHDYYEYARKLDEKTVLYYLTLDGHAPSQDSKRDLKEGSQYKCIAFGVEVLNWIERLLKEEYIKNLPNLYAILTQYKRTLEKMTNRQRKEVEELMKKLHLSRKEFHAANELNRSLPAIKADKMRDFYSAVREKLKERESEFPLAHADYENKAADYYRKTSISYPLPSLNYLLPRLSGAPKQQFVLRIEIESNLYFGVCNWDENTKAHTPGTDNDGNREYIKDHSGEWFSIDRRTAHFYWWRYLKMDGETIDFRECNENYKKLYDEETFRDTVDTVCTEICEFFDCWLSSENAHSTSGSVRREECSGEIILSC